MIQEINIVVPMHTWLKELSIDNFDRSFERIKHFSVEFFEFFPDQIFYFPFSQWGTPKFKLSTGHTFLMACFPPDEFPPDF